MEYSSSHIWSLLWCCLKFYLFLSLFLLSASKLQAASEGPLLAGSATIAAATFSDGGTTSVVVITLCSNIDATEAPSWSLHSTVCWRSSEISTVQTSTLEKSSVPAGKEVLCGIFLCWDGNAPSSSSNKMEYPGSVCAHGISFSAIATGHNDSFRCALVEGKRSVFCWGSQFKNGKFLPFFFIPGFSSTAAASECNRIKPWRRLSNGGPSGSFQPSLGTSSQSRVSSANSLSPVNPPFFPPSSPPSSKKKLTAVLQSIIWIGAIFLVVIICILIRHFHIWRYIRIADAGSDGNAGGGDGSGGRGGIALRLQRVKWTLMGGSPRSTNIVNNL